MNSMDPYRSALTENIFDLGQRQIDMTEVGNGCLRRESAIDGHIMSSLGQGLPQGVELHVVTP